MGKASLVGLIHLATDCWLGSLFLFYLICITRDSLEVLIIFKGLIFEKSIDESFSFCYSDDREL